MTKPSPKPVTPLNFTGQPYHPELGESYYGDTEALTEARKQAMRDRMAHADYHAKAWVKGQAIHRST